jgi:hypothetical protein
MDRIFIYFMFCSPLTDARRGLSAALNLAYIEITQAFMLLYLQERRLRTAYVGNLPLNVTEAQVKEVWTLVFCLLKDFMNKFILAYCLSSLDGLARSMKCAS